MKNLITYLKALRGSLGNLQSKDVRHDCRLTVGSPSGLTTPVLVQSFLRNAAVLCMLLFVGVGNVWGADYTITFATGTGDGTKANTSTAASTCTTAATYVSGNLTTASNVYYKGSDGLKLGTSSGAGDIKFSLSTTGQVVPTKVSVYAKRYNSSKAATVQIVTNLGSNTATGTTASFAEYSYSYSGSSKLTYIEIKSSKYIWVQKVVVTYAATTTYTVSYANGGGTGTAPTSHTGITSGSSITLKDNTFTAPAGKQFAGWNDGTSTYAAGASYKVTGNKTMTAQWTCITPTISVHPSNGSCVQGGSPSPLTVTASGGTLSYQWKQCATSGGTYTNVSGGSGGTTASYTPPVTTPGTMYYKCVVTNTGSSCNTTATSNYASFTVTSSGCTTSPTVTAGSNSAVTYNSATVTCASGISSLGSAGCTITSYGFVIGTSTTPTIGGSGVTKHEVGTTYTTTGTSFNKALTGLTASTTYYVRPYATNGNGTSYGTQTYFTTSAAPAITVSQTSRAFGDKKVNGGPYTMTFNVSGTNLVGNITLAISGTNAAMFSVNETSLTPSTGTVASTEITVSYSPTAAGSHSATIAISSTGATSKTVNLTGTGKWGVTWNNNGATSTTLVANGTKPTFPSTPSPCDATSTAFIGWATAAWSGKIANLTGKTVYTSAGDMPAVTANTTYYAVFAKEVAGTPTTETYTHTIGSKTWESTGDQTLSSVKWTLANNGGYYGYDGTKGQQVGSGSSPATTMSLTTSGISGTITSVKISTSGASSVSASVGVSVGGTNFTSGGNTTKSITATNTEYAFTGSKAGTIVISWSQTSSKALYFKKIVVTYEESSTTYSDYLTTCVACSADPTLSAAPTLKGAISNTSVGVTISSASVRDNCEWTDYGFVWSASSTPTIGANGVTKVQVGTSGEASSWDGTLTGSFTVGTTYYYRGYGKNSKAEADFIYSPQSSFTLRSITFESNGGTAVPTMYVNSGTTATAPSPEPTKDGYTFGGWYTTSGLSTAVNWSNTITANKTYYAKWIATPTLTVSKASIAFDTKAIGNSYTETFTVSGENLTANISIAVDGTNAAMFSVSPTSVAKGSGTVAVTEITVTYTPSTAAAHSATITVSSTGATSKTITLTGTGRYEDKFIDLVQNTTGYTAGSPHTETGSYSTPTLSDKPAATTGTCDEVHYHFVGWITKAKHDAGTAIAAGDIKTPTTANGTTYYAVWAKEGTGGAATVDDVLNLASTGIEDGAGYSDWSDVSATSDAVYAGQSAGGNSSIQIRSKNSNSGIITTTSGGKAKKVTISWNSSTSDGRVVDIYGKSSAYSEVADLYNASKSGTKIGSITYGTSTELSISSDDYTYIGIRSNDGAAYLTSVTIKWSAGKTYTDYVSSCGETYDITLDKNGGTTDGSATVTENAAQLNSGFTAPVWAGHQVEGYYTTSACATKIATAEGVFQKSITVNSTQWTDASGKWVKGGDATFYAKWEAKQCVITLNNVGADIEPGTPSVTATYGANTNLTTPITEPEKTGYVFGGYYTEANGEGTQLIDANGAWLESKTDYTNASKQWQLDQAALTLYAKWTIETYTVNWYVNGISVAHEDNVPYGRSYSNLTNEPTVANNALASCNSNKFIGWVTADGQYTADGGTKSAQYDPYTVTGSTTINSTTKDFYAMFAEETGSAFDLSVTSGDFKIFGLVSDVRYYVTGALDNGAYDVTTDADDADEFTFTKVSDGVYTIKHKRSNKYVKHSSKTNFKEETTAENWTITAASHGSWCVKSSNDATRAFVMYYSASNPEYNNIFKPYSISNVTNTPAQYYYVEIGGGTLTNYRTGCCDEKITLSVTGATNGTVAMTFNNANVSSGASVSTCSASSLVVKVTANAGYTLTNMSISGTNKTLTITPSPITTGLPSTNEMTYTVSVPALATGTLTITPTFTQTYSVTYNLDGGETAGSTATVRYQSGESVTLVTPDPTKTGYNFTGWTVTKAGGGTVSVSAGAFTMPSDNVTVTAGWSAKPLTSISVTPTTAEVYVGQYVELPVTYDPADVLTKGYTLVATPAYCVTTGSTNTTFKITGGRAGVTITENVSETVSIKATADNTKTASVTVTVKPLPVDHFLDLVHGETFADQSASIVDNALSAAYTAPGHADVPVSGEGNACEKGHLHLVGWIESEWADAHLTATMTEMMAAEDGSGNALFHAAYDPMTASGKTYYAVWGHEVE